MHVLEPLIGKYHSLFKVVQRGKNDIKTYKKNPKINLFLIHTCTEIYMLEGEKKKYQALSNC